MDRVELATQAIELALRARRDRPPRFVAFCSSTEMARSLAAALHRLTSIVVVSVTGESAPSDVQSAVGALEEERPTVLVADQAGEEGLNLHLADGLVHVDLPLSPARIEQRIGRLDRLGRARPGISTRVLLPTDHPDSPWAAWQEFLTEALGIYEHSLADVQFLLGDIESEIRRALFWSGANGLREMVPNIRKRLTDERRRLDQQYALDQLDIEAQGATDAFHALERADRAEDRFGDDLDGWLIGVLNLFRRDADTDTFTLDWNRYTRAPETPWRELFEPALQRRLTYRRAVALAQHDTRLIRPGFTLVEETERLLARDDRGTAFATWRPDFRWPEDESEWLGFRLWYVVGVDDERLCKEARGLPDDVPIGALRRQCRSLFPSWVATVDLDSNLAPVTNQLVENILQRPYDRRIDTNLAEAPQLLYGLVDQAHFATLCQQARSRSEEQLRNSPAFRERLTSQMARAEEELDLRQRRVRQRVDALAQAGESDSALDRELKVAAALSSVLREPSVRLETIGCFVISRNEPR